MCHLWSLSASAFRLDQGMPYTGAEHMSIAQQHACLTHVELLNLVLICLKTLANLINQGGLLHIHSLLCCLEEHVGGFPDSIDISLVHPPSHS